MLALLFSIFMVPVQAQVEAAGWFTHLQGRLGGESRCTPASIAEARQLDCNINNYNYNGDPGRYPDQADQLTEELFFQSIAQRSHRSSQCHLQALDVYSTDAAEQARFNQWARDAFRNIEEELRYYVRLRSEYREEIMWRRMALDHHDVSEAQWNSRRRIAELEQKVAELNLSMKALTAKVPLGNHAAVSEALIRLAEREQVSDADFRTAYRDKLQELRGEINRSVRYFNENRNADGTYRIDKDLKINFANSGQIDTAFESMNEGEAFSNSLQCRIEARYRTGHQITEIFKMVALAGATVLASEVVIPIRAGAAALSAASAAARITYMGAEFTLLALNGAVAATTISDVVRSCAGPTVLVSGQSDQNMACDPHGRLNGMLQEASSAACAADILFTAAPGLMEARRGFLAVRNARLAREVAAPVEMDEIVVTGTRPRGRVQRAEDSAGEGVNRRASTRVADGAPAQPPRARATLPPTPARPEPPVVRDTARAEARPAETRVLTPRALAAERTRFTDEFVNRHFATEAQNRSWITLAEDPPAGTRFFDVENSAMKRLNDTLLDKNFVTAVTNQHKQILSDMMEALGRRFPGVELIRYSDFKAMRYGIRPRPPATQLPAGFEEQLARTFREANAEFARRLGARGLAPAGENPADWFRAGFAESADEATLASRYARGSAGENRLRHFSDADLQQNMEDVRRMGEHFRANLQRSLENTDLMEASSVAGKLIPRREVFEAARKTRTAEELREFLRRTTGQEVTLSQATELRSYTELVDEFSPGIHVATREVASLADSPVGGFSIDFAGMGAFNGQATADALANSTSIRSALAEARISERGVTALFNHRKQQVQAAVEDVLRRHGIDSEIVASGDDMVVRPSRPVPPEVRREIAAELARRVDPASVRLSHVGEGVESGSERMIMATMGEACEKWIRKAAQGVVAAATLNQTLMLVEVSGTSSANFSANLVLGEGRTPLTAAERGQLQRISADAVRAGCH